MQYVNSVGDAGHCCGSIFSCHTKPLYFSKYECTMKEDLNGHL